VAPTLGLLLDDTLAADDAIAALRRYSLVTSAGDGLVSVHRLVRAVTVDQMTDDLLAQWRQAAALMIEAAIPARTDAPQTWPTCALLLAHAHAALADDNDGMARTAEYLGYSGNPAAARDLCRRIADARSRALDPEHPDPSSPATTSPAGPARPGIRPRPATRPQRCCPSLSGSTAPSTRVPSPSAPTSPA
jgi:hypothetical protein